MTCCSYRRKGRPRTNASVATIKTTHEEVGAETTEGDGEAGPRPRHARGLHGRQHDGPAPDARASRLRVLSGGVGAAQDLSIGAPEGTARRRAAQRPRRARVRVHRRKGPP